MSVLVSFVLQILQQVGGFFQSLLLPIINGIFNSIIALANNFGSILNGAANIISSVFNGVSNTITSISSGISTMIATFANSLTQVIGSLAKDGVQAGAGALALAGGMTALMASMAGGALMNAGAGLGSSIMNLGTGLINSLNPDKKSIQQPVQSPIQQILQLVGALKSAQGVISTMNTNWANVAAQATGAGILIVNNLKTGITSGGVSLSGTISSLISTALTSAQAEMDARPLQLKINGPSNADLAAATNGGTTNQTVKNPPKSKGILQGVEGAVQNTFHIMNPNPIAAANAVVNLLR